MTKATNRTSARQRYQRKDSPVPLAFSFHVQPIEPVHVVTVVKWKNNARRALQDLGAHFSRQTPRQDLPIRSLRMRIVVQDTDSLRLERRLGIWGRESTILWTVAQPNDALKHVSDAVIAWLANDLRTDDQASGELLGLLRWLTIEGELLEIERRRARVFDWDSTRGGTATLINTNLYGYPDLADFVARRLEAKEVFPELGPLRRIVSGQLDQNQAELMTPPIAGQTDSFSLVVRVCVESIPGRPTPIVVLKCSRRLWTNAVRRTSVRELSAYVLPNERNTAIQFSLHRRRNIVNGKSEYAYEPGEDFVTFARAFGLPLDQSGDEIISHGHLNIACPILVVHKQGVGERVNTKSGVPDLDKLMALQRATELLSPYGFEPWQGLEEIATGTRSIANRDQMWRHRHGEDGRIKDFEAWKQQAQANIDYCYGGTHHVVIGYEKSCYQDAQQADTSLHQILGDGIQTQIIPIPRDVHGSRSMLPEPSARSPRQRAELRSLAWRPFVDEVRRYLRESSSRIDGIMIIAPDWYESEGNRTRDDFVNKQAGRITLASELKVPVQYLLPSRDSQFVRRDQTSEEEFENRLLTAWLDLAWKTIGRVNTRKLSEAVGSIYPDKKSQTTSPPAQVLALGVLRRNKTSLANERSFVPFAIELDILQGTCWARFARNDTQGNVVIMPRMNMPEALVELASSGPISLTTSNGDRRKQRREHSEFFFHTVITEFCRRASSPLVLVDAVSCREVWPWLADSRLDPENIVIGNNVHAEADWSDARVVRVRIGTTPKVLFDSFMEGEDHATKEIVQYDAPKWADAQLFKVKDSQTDVYLSFGSLLLTKRILGVSCYRSRVGLKPSPGKPRVYGRTERPLFTGAWSTPTAVEFTVVRTASGEQSNQVVQLVEWLRTVHQHTPNWTTKPAPLSFESTLKEYLADYDLDEEADDSEEEDE